jgi:hypothetical protein
MACAPDALVAAIDVADADDGGTLKLAPNCTYARTANQGGTGCRCPSLSKGTTPYRSRRQRRWLPQLRRRKRRQRRQTLRASWWSIQDASGNVGGRNAATCVAVTLRMVSAPLRDAGRGVARPPARSGDGGGR